MTISHLSTTDIAASMPVNVGNVTKKYGGKTVLSEISLDIRPAEIFGLLGPSGAGKTTLVKLIVGIEEADSGQVDVLGERMPKLDVLNRIGYMAQSDALYAELSALENLEFFGSLFGLNGSKLKQRIHEVMEIVDLSGDLKKAVRNYSGGMKRRLSLAASLLHRPDILILDEPTVGIDPLLRQSIWRELQRLCQQGTTILVTTHVMDEADKCHRLGMIRDGRLIAIGTPQELRERTGQATLEEAFLTYGGAVQ
jgi:ABC-2 type transport system ATP-binding protein